MAAPNVFVSSTFYDLRHVRERIGFFIRSLGYNAILSEQGAVYYDPRRDAAEACVTEIPNCQMFVLVIGGRYGSEITDATHSVTNAEYKEARRLGIPIFALVEYGAHSDFLFYRANVNSPGFDAASFTFPNADDPRVFDFIEEVQSAAVNNALVPFRDYDDIESYLRQQWAGMLHSFLVGAHEERRTQDMLDVITAMNRRIELLSTQILATVGTQREKALAQIYSRMLRSKAIEDLRYIGLSPTPTSVLENESFDAFAAADGKEFFIGNGDTVISTTGEIASYRHDECSADYEELRAALQGYMAEGGLTSRDLADLDPT